MKNLLDVPRAEAEAITCFYRREILSSERKYENKHSINPFKAI
jgi:hypothetical protein